MSCCGHGALVGPPAFSDELCPLMEEAVRVRDERGRAVPRRIHEVKFFRRLDASVAGMHASDSVMAVVVVKQSGYVMDVGVSPPDESTNLVDFFRRLAARMHTSNSVVMAVVVPSLPPLPSRRRRWRASLPKVR